MNPYAAQLYIDGSCYKNPGGPGGLAGVLEIPDDESEPKLIFQEGYYSTTNNRMEITALIRALEYIKENHIAFKSLGLNQVEIRPDSETAIKCHQFAEIWRSNNWKGLNDTPISNVDLIKRILTLKNNVGFSYRLIHIQNKSTVSTKRVDQLAKSAAKKPSKDDSGYIKPKACRTEGSGKTELFKAEGQLIKIRIFVHSPASRRKDSMYKVKFETVVNDSTKKYLSYCSQTVNQLIHRHHYYMAQFNSNKNNPIIETVNEILNDIKQ